MGAALPRDASRVQLVWSRPTFRLPLLVGYTLLPFESRGDTLLGRGEVVTVAEQDIQSARRLADSIAAVRQ